MLFYAAVACPYYYLWTSGGLPTEEWLKRSLAFGAYPMAPRMPRPGPDPETDRIYDAYLPLYELLRGRVLAFDPDPVTFPLGTWGQLYSLPGDRSACVIVRDGASSLDSLRHHRAPEVRLRLPRKVESVRIHYPGPNAAAGRAVQFSASDDGVTIPLADFSGAALVIAQ